MQWVLALLACLLLMLALFLLGWRPVFPDNPLHAALDRVQGRLLEMAASSTAKRGKKVLMEAVQLKLVVAFAKIFFSYFQVARMCI